MTNPLETRALFALYRNHPSTSPGDRWGVSAHRRALAERDMLLAWAVHEPDDRLLACRNLGAASLAWIRAHQPRTGYIVWNATSAPRHVHVGEWCAECVQHGRDPHHRDPNVTTCEMCDEARA